MTKGESKQAPPSCKGKQALPSCKGKQPLPDYDAWPIPKGEICEMNCSASHTYFCVWSPTARQARALIYEEGEGGKPILTIPLCKHEDGTLSASIGQDLRGRFYVFRIQHADGRWSRETPGIFAKAVGVNGKRGYICSEAAPIRKTHIPRNTTHGDAIIYELHLRDFTISSDSGIRHKGKYLGLTERGTKSADGQPSGLDHLVELGVTHVHLLPVFDFGSIDESRTDCPQYNWGYDPVNYNVPEGSYSNNPYDPMVRIREFRQMVDALHEAGIKVVMDVVFNHVYDLGRSNFEQTAPGYFFRWKEDGMPSNGSGCGNETASERPMMRKFMIESVLYWIKEYHIDGFRFDLMGLHDIETMKAIRKAVNCIDPSVIIYGEGWTADTPALPHNRLALKQNASHLPGIAVFNDELRDALRGPWDNDRLGAFVIGKPGYEEAVKQGIAGQYEWAEDSAQTINYVSCHDDLCIADRLTAYAPTPRTTANGKSSPKRQQTECLLKLAYTAVFASRGIPFIWCGDEMMRNRKGIRNCYNKSDSVNAIRWSLKTEHPSVFEYIKTLIALRKQWRWYDHKTEFLPTRQSNVIAIHYPNVLIVLNSSQKPGTVDLQLTKSTSWSINCQTHGIAEIRKGTLKVPPQCAVILTTKAPHR